MSNVGVQNHAYNDSSIQISCDNHCIYECAYVNVRVHTITEAAKSVALVAVESLSFEPDLAKLHCKGERKTPLNRGIEAIPLLCLSHEKVSPS